MNWAEILTPFNLTLAILVIAAVFFMRGKVRSDLVALCTLLALLLLNILTPSEALAGFASPVVIMMLGLFVVGAGIFRTGLAKVIGSRILKLARGNENLLFVLVMLVTAFVGAFVSNTGTVAVMMPIVISMAASAGINTRRYLMPLAFASSMGMFTLISTPPNLVVQEALVDNGYEPLSFFGFAPVGFTAITVGIVVLFFLSRKLNVKKEKERDQTPEKQGKSLTQLVEEYNLRSAFHKVLVPSGSPLVGHSLDELQVATRYNVSIGRVIRRQTASRFPRPGTAPVEEEPTGETVLRSGDTLYCFGGPEKIERFMSENGLKEQKPDRREINRYAQQYGLVEAFILPDSTLINHTVRESGFRDKYNLNILGLKRQKEKQIGEMKQVKMRSGDSLLIQGTWDDIAALDANQEDLIIIGQPEKMAADVTLDQKAPVAAVIMLAMVLVMAFNVVEAVTAVLAAAILMVVTGCLRNMEEAYTSINWNSVVLIAAMIPMATAFDKTGVTAAISGGLLQGVGGLGPWAVLAAIYFTTSVLTMFLSNTATAVLFAPIAMQAAVDMQVQPYAFLMAVAVAASMCFASPFSTPPNALVMSAGRYTFKDYVRIGLPLQLIMAVVMILLLPLFFPF